MSKIKNVKRYILLLNKSDKKSINSLEKEFKTTIISSKELNRNNKSFNILGSNKSIHYKNINVLVIDDLDPNQLLTSINDIKSPLIHYEEDRIFRPINQLDIIKSLRENINVMTKKLDDLEEIIYTENTKPSYTDMEWGLQVIGIPHTQLTGKDVDICILDTGFDLKHPDFLNRSIEGKSFVPNEDWDTDLNGHGTHCAGTACGDKRLDTGKRYGVATEANIKIAKIFGKDGTGTTSTILDAIDWAISQKFRVISMSIGAPVEINEKPSLIFEITGEKALENNCLIIAAAGNDSNRPSLPKPVSSPANSVSIMSVAALDEQMKVAKFSNGGLNSSNGGEVNLCGPGVSILSSYPTHKNNFSFLSGTSMATPHVSGLAALYMEAYPDLNAKEIWNKLEENCKKIENAKYRDVGNGLAQIPQ